MVFNKLELCLSVRLFLTNLLADTFANQLHLGMSRDLYTLEQIPLFVYSAVYILRSAVYILRSAVYILRRAVYILRRRNLFCAS